MWSELFPALRQHVYRAKMIVYCTFLVACIVQITIRERFPELHPPWPLIGGTVMVVLFGVLVLPPLLLVIKLRRQRRARNDDRIS
jgi:hypothetical protein